MVGGIERWRRGRYPRLSEGMRRVLDAIELSPGGLLSEVNFRRYGGGGPWSASNRETKRLLRGLIELGLVEVMGISPGRYRVTRLGKLTRGLRG